jgi:adenine-specific DNA-methyltransferase
LAVRLHWEGKPDSVERVTLPFQTVETINESRATRERDAGALFRGGDSSPGWRNLLVWGDNRSVMSSLLDEYAGKIKLIYIDPPFATGDDFSVQVQIGDGGVVDKEPSVLEEHAYRDTWGRGYESYLTMMYERLVLMHELLSEDGSIYVHSGTTVNHLLRCLCDEIFGSGNFRNEIVWKRFNFHADAGRFGRVTDRLLFYSRSANYSFNEQRVPFSEEYVTDKFTHVDEDGRRFRLSDLNPPAGRGPVYEFNGVTRAWRISENRMHALNDEGRIYTQSKVAQLKRYLDELEGQAVHELWDDVSPINPRAAERLGYPTQKPESLLERLIEASSSEGDVVADFFVGSGTTPAVAERLGRRWIACDLGRFAVHTTRKRLLNIPDCSPFDIQNLGAYERQRWQIESGNGVLRAYLETILAFYRAEPVEGFSSLHGRKADRMVHVGATDAPVTIDETEEVMDEMADNGVEACDLLGWEWEMGLHDTITERARRRGLDLRPRQIPREVMERQVSEADAVRFFELAFVDLDVRRKGHEACVVLKDFAIPSEDLIPQKVRESINSWSDLIDYWSVDFDFSDEVFHNQWQAYRTREDPTLATQSDWHEYPTAGTYGVVVKIIDIFGNDTTKLAEVRIK